LSKKRFLQILGTLWIAYVFGFFLFFSVRIKKSKYAEYPKSACFFWKELVL
jgi:hypothetical protein